MHSYTKFEYIKFISFISYGSNREQNTYDSLYMYYIYRIISSMKFFRTCAYNRSNAIIKFNAIFSIFIRPLSETHWVNIHIWFDVLQLDIPICNSLLSMFHHWCSLESIKKSYNLKISTNICIIIHYLLSFMFINITKQMR